MPHVTEYTFGYEQRWTFIKFELTIFEKKNLKINKKIKFKLRTEWNMCDFQLIVKWIKIREGFRNEYKIVIFEIEEELNG